MTHLAGPYTGAHATTGVFAAPSRREQLFGITNGIYACANELEEFGLIERTTPRQPGKLPAGQQREVDRWQVPQDALKRDACDTVTTALREKPTPGRMARYDPLNNLAAFPRHRRSTGHRRGRACHRPCADRDDLELACAVRDGAEAGLRIELMHRGLAARDAASAAAAVRSASHGVSRVHRCLGE